MSLQKLQRPQEALAYFARVIEQLTQSGDDWFNRGLALSGLHRIEEAEAAYRHALRAQPDSLRARMNLGVMCGLLGKHRQGQKENQPPEGAGPVDQPQGSRLGVVRARQTHAGHIRFTG